MKSTKIPALIFVINFRNEIECSETGSNLRFRKNVKTCLQNMKSYLISLSRHGYFHPILNLHVKIVKLPQQNTSTTVH